MAKVFTMEISASNTLPASPVARKVAAKQAAIDALPFNSGTWRVEGSMGLYVRCRAQSKSFLIQRKVNGRVVQRVIGQVSLAEARRIAQRMWSALKPPPADEKLTLAEVWTRYLDEKPLSDATKKLYRYNLRKYLSGWAGRSLEELGNDRAGIRTLYQAIRRRHGDATAAQINQMLSAVYRYFRRVNPELPPTPTEVIDTPPRKSRDWALADEELRVWWEAVQRLQPLKQAMWLTLLMTGARAASVQHLRWQDVDLDRAVIRFAVAKGGRAYSVPAPRRLVEILRRWREHCPPTEAGWVFPSPVRPEQPLQAVRDDKRGVVSAHHLRHTMRTRLAEAGATPDLARIALGHSLLADVSQRYITPSLLVEAVRPLMDAVADRYAEILELEAEDNAG